MSLNAERILNINDATAASVRLASSLRSERFLFSYDDLIETRNRLLAENLAVTGNAGSRDALREMVRAGADIEALERESIELMAAERWDDARALLLSPHYKRLKGLYRANLSRVLSTLVDEGTQHARRAGHLADAMRLTVLLAFLLFAGLGRVYAGRMRAALATERQLKARLEHANASLEQRVMERTEELSRKAAELGDAYEVISASIRYASRIQRAVLPDADNLARWQPRHFLLWQPRDVVGGDMLWFQAWGDGELLVLGDCTGHGVPGAFMTLIATGALQHAMASSRPGDLGGLLSLWHRRIQSTLGQDGETGGSDDGLEVAACYLTAGRDRLFFAGAGMGLYLVEDGEARELRGARHGLAYRDIPADQCYPVQALEVGPGLRFYLVSDGFTEQVGHVGARRRMYGKSRFRNLLARVQPLPMKEQVEVILQDLVDFQGDERRRDDVTVFGAELPLLRGADSGCR